jgi:amidase
MFELHHLTAQEQWSWLHRGDITPVDLITHYLGRVERLNPELGAFATVTGEAALDRARNLEQLVPKSAALWGLPSGDKDLTRRAGVRTTFGSRLFENFVPDTSDELVELLDAAGAISLGKTTAPEFGLPSYTESLVAPPARNPWRLDLGAGGSSGGAAAAVSAGLLPVATGSDGGGSIRIPAAATGLVGVKPGRGVVPSGSGLTTLAGLVTTGPLARNVADAAMLLDAMIAGSDYRFSVRSPGWGGEALLGPATRGEGRFQLGVMTTSPWDSAYDITLDVAATSALELAVVEFSTIGHGIEEVALEPDDSYAPAFRTIWQAGAADIPAEGDELELLEPLTRWLVERGRQLTARELGSALGTLTTFERSIIRQFASFDAVLTPAMAQTPRPIGWYSNDDPELNFAQQVQYTPFTSFANVTGLPAMTLPILQTEDGLPMGVQLVGRPGGEATLFSLAAQLERRIGWQHRHPAVW